MEKPRQIANIDRLPSDVLREIALKLSYPDIESYSKTYKKFRDSLTKEFWNKKLLRDFNKTSNNPEADYLILTIKNLEQEVREKDYNDYPEYIEAEKEYMEAKAKFRKIKDNVYKQLESDLYVKENEIEKLTQKIQRLNIKPTKSVIKISVPADLERNELTQFLNKKVKKAEPGTLVLVVKEDTNEILYTVYYYQIGNQTRKDIRYGYDVPTKLLYRNGKRHNINDINIEYGTKFK